MEQEYNKEGLYYYLIKAVHELIFSIKRNLLLFILCIALPACFVAGSYLMSSKQYQASFTVNYEELFRKIYGDRLDKLNELLHRKEYDKVASLIHVTPQRAANLKKIEGKNILGDDLSKDLNTDRIPFIVEYTVDDSTNILEYQNGIIQFLETGNAYLSDKKKIKQVELIEELQFIDSQLQILSTLKDAKTLAAYANGIDVNSASGGRSSLFEFSYELYKKKQDIQRKISMPQNISVLDDAIVSHKRSGLVIRFAISLVAGSIIFFSLVFLVIPAIRFKD